MTVLSSAMTVGSVSGGAFNPAVSTGLQLVQCVVAGRCQALSYIWMYFIAEFGGAALAAGCFLIIHPHTGIKQHTGAEDNAEAWSSVLPTASKRASQRVSMLPPKTVAASNDVDPSLTTKLVTFAETNSTAADASQNSLQQLQH
jgi:hypothetical protein